MTPDGTHAGIQRTVGHGGRHVLLIHGALDRAAGMALLARHLAPHADTTRYDRRGYGSRWEESGSCSIDAHIDDAIRILDGRASWLVGHSLGGDIALGVADRRPDLVRGVTVYETPLSWMPFWPQDSAGGASVRSGPEKGAEAFMIRMIGQERWDALPDRTKEARRREGRALVEELSSLRTGPPWRPDAITCPVIVGRGSRGAEHHRLGAEWIAEHIAGAELRILEGAGHGAHTTHARLFTEELVLPLLSS